MCLSPVPMLTTWATSRWGRPVAFPVLPSSSSGPPSSSAPPRFYVVGVYIDSQSRSHSPLSWVQFWTEGASAPRPAPPQAFLRPSLLVTPLSVV